MPKNNTSFSFVEMFDASTSAFRLNYSNHVNVPTFDSMSQIKLGVYAVMFVIAFTGNGATLFQMYKLRKRKSTTNLLIMNLCMADITVTFFVMLVDALWTYSVQWYAGDVMCRFVKYMQGFGMCLSTYVTVVISLDRCFAIVNPLGRTRSPRRVKEMIAAAWIFSAVFSVPQALIFQVLKIPDVNFYQCVTHGAYKAEWQKQAYSIATLSVLFVIPLFIMATAYGLIFATISRKSREFEGSTAESPTGFRTNCALIGGQIHSTLLRKAKRKSLRMSLFIVAAFVICWSPYFVIFNCMSFLNLGEIDPKILLPLTFMGLSNTMLNPAIYGAFNCLKSTKRHAPVKDKRTLLITQPEKKKITVTERHLNLDVGHEKDVQCTTFVGPES